MDEEELGATGKKITIANFFESIKSIDKLAKRALEASELNLGKIDATNERIKELRSIISSIQADIKTLQENDEIRRNELEDRLLEQQDALQKEEMIERQKQLKGEKGEKGDTGATGEPGQGEDRKDTPKQDGGGFFSNIGQGIIGAGSIVAASIFNPLAAIMGGNYGGMPINQPRDRVTPPKTNLLETINPFARLGGMFGRKVGEKNEKDKVKEEIKSEIKQELNLKDDKKESKLIGERVQKGEKKENKLMNFVKQGGVAGFLGRKIFGKKDKENKPQENDATNPESTTFSESIQYSGRLDPRTFKFIVDESSLEPGVTPERAEQHYYKTQVELLEEDFKDNVVFNDMSREDAIETYGPQSNLYRFKENYNNTLEYGGYELDVGKHYDFVKQSYLGGNEKKGREAPLKGEKRGIKGIIGGIADSLTGGFFDFDKRGNTGMQDFVQGTADTLTGGFFDFDKKGNTKLQDFQQGTADTLTGGFFDFDKKGNTKLQDFQQGTADTLTGGIFDFDKKGSNKLQKFQQGFMDSMTGNLTDFDRKGGKPTGLSKVAAGMLDFATGNMFDLDKSGGFDLFGGGKEGEGINTYEKEGEGINTYEKDEKKSKGENVTYKHRSKTTTIEKGGSLDSLPKEVLMKAFTKLNDKRIKAESDAKKGDKSADFLSRIEQNRLTQLKLLLEAKFKVNTSNIKSNVNIEDKTGLSDDMNLIEVDPNFDFDENPYEKKKPIQPVIESKEKDLSSNIYKEIDNTNQAVSNLVTQNVAQTGNANDQNTSMQVPANEPQVSDAEIKSARPNIPFISVLTNKTKKEMSLTSEGSSDIAGYID